MVICGFVLKPSVCVIEGLSRWIVCWGSSSCQTKPNTEGLDDCNNWIVARHFEFITHVRYRKHHILDVYLIGL